MRLVYVDKLTPGVVELHWMWLPTFIGTNQYLLRELQNEAFKRFGGQPLTDEKLDEIDRWFIDQLCLKHPVRGIRKFFEAIGSIELDVDEPRPS
jgi:hypothetical protein